MTLLLTSSPPLRIRIDFFDAEIQIPETLLLQALLPYPPPPPPPPECFRELARRLSFLDLSVSSDGDSDVFRPLATLMSALKRGGKADWPIHTRIYLETIRQRNYNICMEFITNPGKLFYALYVCLCLTLVARCTPQLF